MNYTWNDSEITKLNVIDSDANFVQTGAISGTGKTVQVFMVGQRPYTFYLAKQAYDDDGKPMEGQYVQPDGSISATETKYATDKSALPTSYLGFNTQLTYKNWDLPSADTGHSATMYTIMWLPTSMYNPCTAIRATSPTYCAEPKIPVSRTSSFIRIISWKGQLLPY